MNNNDLDHGTPSNTGNNEPTESQPLLGEEQSEATHASSRRRGISLWRHVRERTESIVYGMSNSWESFSDAGDREIRRNRRIEQIQASMRYATEFPLSTCLLGIVVYLAVAVICYSFIFEEWDVIDSLYFGCVTFTTIGYGDLVPSTDASRLFTAFFALIGVSVLGIALGVVGSNLLDAEQNAVDRAMKLQKRHALTLFDTERYARMSSADAGGPTDIGHVAQTPWYRSPLFVHTMPLFVLLFSCCWMLGTATEWGVIDTFYFSIISACTIGFGDFHAKTKWSRLFAVFFIPVAVGAMGAWLSLVAKAIVDRRQARYRKSFESYKLTLRDLEAMDDDGDGQVTRSDWLAFMLIVMKKIDAETIHDLNMAFDRLDLDGTGVLHRNDLILQAKKNLMCSKRKLELAEYKKQLLSASKRSKLRRVHDSTEPSNDELQQI